MAEAEHSDKSNFMSTIEDIRKAEEDAEKAKEEAGRKADSILMKAKENVMRYSTETDLEVTKIKNSIFQKQSANIEGEIEDMLGEAKKSAEQIRKKSLGQKESISIMRESFFTE